MNTLIQKLSDLSAELLEAHNQDVREFNELFDRYEALEQSLAERDELLTKQNELIVHQKNELDGLLKKHNNEMMKANVAIRELQGSVAAKQNELNKYRDMNPDKMAKQIANLKERNAELLANNDLLKRRNADLGKSAVTLKKGVDNALKPIWAIGRESLMEAGTMMVTTCGAISEQAVWWRHDSGFQLLCVLDSVADEIRIADPAFETGVIPLPSDLAVENMKSILYERLNSQKAA